jgi:hypothetical protein
MSRMMNGLIKNNRNIVWLGFSSRFFNITNTSDTFDDLKISKQRSKPGYENYSDSYNIGFSPLIGDWYSLSILLNIGILRNLCEVQYKDNIKDDYIIDTASSGGGIYIEFFDGNAAVTMANSTL